MKKTIAFLILSALALPGLASAQSWRRLSSNQQVDSSSRTQVATSDRNRSADTEDLAAPNFTLTDLEGHSVSLESLRGKVVMLNFWATWCPYCVDDLPVVEQLQREFRNQGLVVLAINLEDADTARVFMQQHGYTFKTLVDADRQVSQLYDIEALPTVLVIGRDGKIATRMVGARSKSTLSEAIALAGIKTNSRDAE
jgi:peroxiredoxin